MTLLSNFIHLPIQEKHLFFKAIFLLVSYRIRLKTTSLHKLFTELEKKTPRVPQHISQHPITPKRLVQIISKASHFIPYTTCLSLALTGKTLFTENNYNTHLHIGVCNDPPNGFEAHAWLSLDGQIILGHTPDLDRYKEFPPLSPQGLT